MLAARVMDTTAHGGFISGPGCPTVLIGKMPAARMGDMHVCPMVTPGTPPIPHVGGPITLGCPTVLIGKMPAARQTDMCVCVGPPSSILMGCPTVMIGSGGGGGGGGASSPSAKTAAAAEALKAGEVSPVEGTETFPVELQAAFVEMNKYLAPETIKLQIQVIAEALEKGRGEAREKKEKVKLTIADFVEILKAVESEENFEAARFFASHLDYGELTELAEEFVHSKEPDPKNDPNQMPTRFMLLYGMDDGKLQCQDDHPDRFDGEDHRINVANLRKGLGLLGYDLKETGPYDDEVYRAHLQYLSAVSRRVPSALHELEDVDGEKKYTVKDGENLGAIALKFGLCTWKYLYTLNKEKIGDNPALLKSGTKLTIPVWDSTGGDEKIEEKGGKAFKYTGGMRYRYPWMPFSITVFLGDDSDFSALEDLEVFSGDGLTDDQFDKYIKEVEADRRSCETDDEEDEIAEIEVEDEEVETERRVLELDEETEVLVTIPKTDKVVYKGTIKRGDEFGMLLPVTPDINIGIKGFPIEINGRQHRHPDDKIA